MKSLVVAVAAFIAGAVLGGALVDLTIEYGLMAFDLRLLGSAVLIGGVAGVIAVLGARGRRKAATHSRLFPSRGNGKTT
jgi:hypothetical protein